MVDPVIVVDPGFAVDHGPGEVDVRGRMTM